MLRNKKGFTLMEILVVVTIIGILAAIAVPSYLQAVEQGRREACAANIEILLTQVERYHLTTGQKVPTSGDWLGFLRQKGYLVGKELYCPFYGEACQPRYVLVYDGAEPIVYCTHCGGGPGDE